MKNGYVLFLNTLLEHLLLKVSYYVFVDIKLMRSNLVFHKCWVRGRKRRLKRCNKTDNRRRNINYALLSQKKGQLSEWKIFIVGVIKRGFFVLDFFISHLSVITFAFYILYCCSLLLSTEFMAFYSLYILRYLHLYFKVVKEYVLAFQENLICIMYDPDNLLLIVDILKLFFSDSFTKSSNLRIYRFNVL